MFANNIPPTAELACWISETNSAATARCFIKGCAVGLSRSGSNGSRGLIKWARMQILGSDTSNTLNGPFLSVSLGDGNCTKTINYAMNNNHRIHSGRDHYTHWNTLGQESIDALHGNDEAVSVHRRQGNWLCPRNSILTTHSPVLRILATHSSTTDRDSISSTGSEGD